MSPIEASFEETMAEVTRDWKSLTLQTMNKRRLSKEDIETLVRFRRDEAFWQDAAFVVLTRFKRETIRALMRHASETSQLDPADDLLTPEKLPHRYKIKNIPIEKLHAAIAHDLALLANVISGRDAKKIQLDHLIGLFDERLASDLHTDAGKGLLHARMGTLPVHVIDPQHPDLHKKTTARRIAQAKNYDRPAIRFLMKRRILKPAPLNAVILISGNHSLHVSSFVPKQGRHSAYYQCIFD